MKLIVDIDSITYERIKSLVETGEYDSVEQFLRAGVDNQLTIEFANNNHDLQAQSPSKGENSTTDKSSPSDDGTTVEDSGYRWSYRPSTDSPIRSPFRADRGETLLFSQYYRFVPLKFAIVELAEKTADRGGPIPLDSFREYIREAVIPLRDALVDWEIEAGVKKQDRFSTGFPKRDSKNPDRSMKRYLDHYVGRFRREVGKPAGLGHQLAFVSIHSDDQMPTIAVTPAGRRFLELDNPLLADGPGRDRPTLSDKERDYLVAHIRRTLPWEYEFIEFVYDTVDFHEGSYAEHLDKFRMFLDQAPGFTEDPTENRIRSQTAGTISRMVDLGLLERGSRRGEYVSRRPPEAFRFPAERPPQGLDAGPENINHKR